MATITEADKLHAEAESLRTAAAALRREEKPAAWAIYTPDGNIPMLTTIEELALAKSAEWDLPITPLYAGQSIPSKKDPK